MCECADGPAAARWPPGCTAFDISAGIDDEDGMDTLLRAIDRADDGGLAYPRLLVEHALDVLGKHIEAVGRDDHFLLAAFDEQPPLRVALADVAGMQPPLAIENALRVGSWELGVVGRWDWASGVSAT